MVDLNNRDDETLIRCLRSIDFCQCEVIDHGHSTRDFIKCIPCQAADRLETLRPPAPILTE